MSSRSTAVSHSVRRCVPTGMIAVLAALALSLFFAPNNVYAQGAGEIGAPLPYNSESEHIELLDSTLSQQPAEPYVIKQSAPEDAQSLEGGFSRLAASESERLPLSISPLATSGSIPDSKISWSIAGGKLSITGSGSMPDYGGASSAPWLENASEITSISIGSGITSIGSQAFIECANVTSVSIANTVKSIGEAAFYRCTSLQSVVLPSSVTNLGTAVFNGCTSLTNVSGGSYTALSPYVFAETGFTSYTVPKGITSIASTAFFDTGIKAFTVASGNTVFTAKDGVLFTNSGKTLLLYPRDREMESYLVPSGTTRLAESSFQLVKNLKEIVIADSVTEAGMFTFYESSLEFVEFGKGLKSTSYQMFEKCANLQSISFGGLSALFGRTFANCSSLTSVSLPATITSIGNGCFGNCYNLQSFSATGLSNIPHQAFLNDRSLTSMNLGNKLTHIYREAFYGCSSLASITLPSSCIFVHEIAFPAATEIVPTHAHMEKYGRNGYRLMDHVAISRTERYDYAFKVLDLVNQRRAENGLAALVMDAELLDCAMERAGETVALFAHTRPDGSSALGISAKAYGENIAVGQASPASAMESWMNSQGHRENILASRYESIGVGVVEYQGVYYWVQLFGIDGSSSSCSKPANKTANQVLSLAQGTFDESITSTGTYWGEPESYLFTYKLSVPKTTMTVGQTQKLGVTFSNPEWGNTVTALPSKIAWASSNKAVAPVDGSGVVTAKAIGTTIISAPLGATTLKSTVRVATSLAGASVAAIPDQLYNAAAKLPTPKPQVKLGSSLLKEGVDYTLSYKYSTGYKKSQAAGGKYVGSATVTATGKGAYTGSVSKTFKVYTYADGKTARAISVKAVDRIEKLKSGANAVAQASSKTMETIAKPREKTMTVKWKAVSGATNYLVGYKSSNAKTWSYAVSGGKTSHTFTGMKEGNLMEFRVAVYDGKKMARGEWTQINCRFYREMVSLKAATGAGKISLSWGKVSGATGYQALIATKADFSDAKVMTSKGGSTTKATITTFGEKGAKLKSGKTYYVKMRAVKSAKNANGKQNTYIGIQSLKRSCKVK